MGTRGWIVLVVQGKLIVMYNHYDSYPEWLGKNLTEEIKELYEKYGRDVLCQMILDLKIINSASPKPTAEEVELLLPYCSSLLTGRKITNWDWYCLLRECQGSLSKTLESGYALTETADSLSDCKPDLLIEYVYILNFDDNTFKCNGHNYGSLDNIQEKWYEL